MLVGTDLSTETDKNGQFIFTKAPSGEVTVIFSREGYATVTKTAEVDPTQLMPASFTVEMLPVGVTRTGEGLSGVGTAYLAYSREHGDLATGTRKERLSDLDLVKILTVTGADGVFHPHSDSPAGLYRDPSKRPTNPTTAHPNSVMLYPPAAPQRSTFLKLNSEPYYLAFDASGDNLYVAGQGNLIKVFDESDNHEKIANIPVAGIVGSLERSDDGKWILAGVIGEAPGVMVIDAASAKATAFLPLDTGGGSPSHVVSGPGDTLLVTVDHRGSQGKLMMVDAYTGATLAQIPVGNAPTCVSTTQDRSRAYVVNSQSGNLTVVDLKARSALGLLRVGVAPKKSALTPDGNRLLVTNSGSDTLSVIDVEQSKVTGFVRVGRAPVGLDISSDGKWCYIANRDWGNMSVVNLESLKLAHLTDPLPLSKPLDVVLRP